MNYGKSILKRFGSLDLSNYVQKVTGKSLIADSEITRLANVTGGTLTPEQLAAIAAQVPVPTASQITEDATHRFTTDSEKITWSAKIGNDDIRLGDARSPLTHSHSIVDLSGVVASDDSRLHASGSDNQDLSSLVTNDDSRLTNARPASDVYSWAKTATKPLYNASEVGAEAANVNIQNHVSSAHAPSNAQANADITKAEMEAKLTGAISSHSHSGGADPFMAKLVLSADKPTAANTTPVTLGLTFNYEANSKYIIDMYMIVAPTAATTGCGFLLDVSSAVTYVGLFASHQLANTGTISGAGSIGDAGVTAQGVSSGMPNTGSNFVYGGGSLITGANTGTATFFFRSETTAITTCKANSIIRVMKI